ncbi:hypothetical protein [Rudaea cellulosilytica]|uniref:hypothetical protein n=1 Tax=Rudaea cellulosilytica TaxID=540746 RepID=UPI00037F40E5|nr:hypothetical protein [Rudaea cellulosilytica]
MMTKISIAEDADAWCRRLGNFAPIVYRPAPANANLPRLAYAAARSTAAAAHAQMRGAATQFLLVALIAAALAWPITGAAQMGGGMGGHGGHGSHGGQPSSASATKNPDVAVRAPSPLRAMLGEMRKLRADLLLTPAQIEPWSKMEDALRECVELERSRQPVVQTGTSIDAPRYVQDLADNERALADAEGRFAAATKTAFAALNPRQLQTTRDRLAGAVADTQGAPPAAP